MSDRTIGGNAANVLKAWPDAPEHMLLLRGYSRSIIWHRMEGPVPGYYPAEHEHLSWQSTSIAHSNSEIRSGAEGPFLSQFVIVLTFRISLKKFFTLITMGLVLI
jgi:hypothetical protein